MLLEVRAQRSFPGTSAPSSSSGGFFPADLTRGQGPLVKRAIFHDIDFDCAESCWGKPSAFLNDLGNSTFIHVVDRYVGATANGRYTVGANVSASAPLFTNTLGQNDILAIVHAAAAKLGKTGYGHIYHLFLPNGVDTCFDQTNICYSPDNPSSFAFCGYHGSVTYSDIGHVLLSVEPFQNVDGCSVATPSPNGALVDSTANVLSHETFETITDPDPPATFADLLNGNFGWLALNSLTEFGSEIGDDMRESVLPVQPGHAQRQELRNSAGVFKQIPHLCLRALVPVSTRLLQNFAGGMRNIGAKKEPIFCTQAIQPRLTDR